jgi:DNA-binding CsgD family transcriptional regulator
MKKQIAWTSEKIAEVKRLLGEGYSYADIGAVFGCQGATVGVMALRHGVNKYRYWDDGDDKLLKYCLELGCSRQLICDLMGFTRPTVQKKVEAVIGKGKPGGNHSKAEWQARHLWKLIEKLQAEGWDLKRYEEKWYG